MSEQPKPVSQRPPATASEAVKLLTAAAIGSSLLFVSGLTLTGTVIALVMATPILVLCSPILVPAGIVVLLVVTGFFFSCGCALAAVVALTWIYRYVTGKHPPGSDKLDYAREKIAEKAKDMRERAKEYGQYVQQKTQETTQTQQKPQETTQTQQKPQETTQTQTQAQTS